MGRVKKERVWELDFLRGFSIILVVFDHIFFDYGSFFGEWRNCESAFLRELNAFSASYLTGELRFFWRPAFLFVFFCVSGICTALSNNNFLRGVKLWSVAATITIITYLGRMILGTPFILFGVLHCLATVIIIYSFFEFTLNGILKLVERKTKKSISETIKIIVFCAVYLCLSAITLVLNFKFNPRLADMERYARVSTLDGKLYGMFFYSDEWWTGDYFPVFPFISFFFFGAFLSKALYSKKKTLLPCLEGVWHTPITFAGRHSLIVYLLGQIIGILLGVILSLIFLGKPVIF